MAGISISGTFTSWTPEVLYLMVSEANRKGAEHVISQAQQNLQRGGHNDTGNLSRSFNLEFGRFGLYGATVDVVNTASYASFVNDGVAGNIYPTSAAVLRFKPGKKGGYLGKRGVYNAKSTGRFSSDYLYRPYVKGQAATHFFTDAVNSLSVYDFI